MLEKLLMFFSTYRVESPPVVIPQNVTIDPNLNDSTNIGNTDIDASELL